jgi:hypothetical protein
LHDSRPDSTFLGDMQELSILAVCAPGPRFRFRAHIVDPCDILSLLDLFWDDLAQFTIFSRLSTRARMSILIADSNPLRKNEFNEYKVKDIQTTFYFYQCLFLDSDMWRCSPSLPG